MKIVPLIGGAFFEIDGLIKGLFYNAIARKDESDKQTNIGRSQRETWDSEDGRASPNYDDISPQVSSRQNGRRRSSVRL